MKTFPEYWRSLSAAQKAELAKKSGSSVNTLAQISGGHLRVGLDLLVRLVRADEKITPAMLRPDILAGSRLGDRGPWLVESPQEGTSPANPGQPKAPVTTVGG